MIYGEWGSEVRKVDLTDFAMSIFGEDIVKEAYTFSNEYRDSRQDIGKNKQFSNKKIEPIDAYPVTVIFNNGKKFSIWSSEWGGIESI